MGGKADYYKQCGQTPIAKPEPAPHRTQRGGVPPPLCNPVGGMAHADAGQPSFEPHVPCAPRTDRATGTMKSELVPSTRPAILTDENITTAMPQTHYEVLDHSELDIPVECRIPKSISLPLQGITEVPDPFPDLTPYSPLTPSGSKTNVNALNANDHPSVIDLGLPRRRISTPESPKKRAKDGYLYRRHSEHEMGSSSNTPKIQNIVKSMLKFHNEDGSHKSMSIEGTMQASDVCNLLCLANRVSEDVNWAIVETTSKFSLERSLEDHESALHVYRNWGHTEENKFFFRKDFQKYERFQSTLVSFPAQMVGLPEVQKQNKETKEQREQRRNALTLRCILDDEENAPDIQGHMVLREGKRSWKKYYFVLRKSGLYYCTKGTSKDPNNLLLLSTLANVNIFTAQKAKKTLGAPNNNCIVLKPKYCVNDINELKCLCVDDEQTRSCWLAAMRLVKHGEQLMRNVEISNSNQNKLRSIENQAPFMLSRLRTRPSMDLSISRGSRMVVEATEAEVKHIRQQVAMPRKSQSFRHSSSSRGSPPLRSSPPSRGSPSPRCSPPPRRSPPLRYSPPPECRTPERQHSPRLSLRSYPGLSADAHLLQPWFYGNITREDAVNLITESGLIDGTFLLRESNSQVGTYVLSMAHNNKVKHCQILKVEVSAQWFYTLDGGHTKFMDLVQLVEFYQLNPSGLPTKLTHHITPLI